MAENDIPSPHADDINAARQGLEIQALSFGLDIGDLDLVNFIDHVANVMAWTASERRHLKSLMTGNT